MTYKTDILISREQTSNGTWIEIRHTTKVYMSKMYSFYLRQLAELIDRRLAYPMYLPEIDSYSAIYVIQDSTVIGHIVYRSGKENKISYIALSAVKDTFRGNGLYEIMHKHFEDRSKINGSQYILSWTHKNNISRQRSAAKVGLEIRNIVLGKYIK